MGGVKDGVFPAKSASCGKGGRVAAILPWSAVIAHRCAVITNQSATIANWFSVIAN
jgi:hypothetical protein